MDRRTTTHTWETQDFRPAAQQLTYAYDTDSGTVLLPLAGYLVQHRTILLDGLHYTEPDPTQPPVAERPARIWPAVIDSTGQLVAFDDPDLGHFVGVRGIVIELTEEN
ncbi:hypothetical protein FEZ32_07430 [Acidipropionibacterium jensenii]|uniref:hypothetical protein n=1 Tax=Acidipropionibacterium jensenii TaxID=1749 RepID=UPI00110AF2EB|nr:hypothetical protein [Acidipropionibacterium jensenii]QCV88206.1 hypothetical protein FEZ32_07430 [Acidipropionibacterium jensenii]